MPNTDSVQQLLISKPVIPIEDDAKRPVYLQDWWLNITAPQSDKNQLLGNRWLTVSENNTIVGTMVYTIYRDRLGLKQGRDSALSHINGPIIIEGAQDDAAYQIRRDKIVCKLIEQLPLNVSHFFTLPPGSIDYTLFIAAGFTYAYEQSYRIYPGDPEKIRAGFFHKTRSRLRKAERELDVITITPEQFVQFYTNNLKSTNSRSNLPFDIAAKLLTEGITRGQARIIAACHKGSSVPIAAIATVWDRQCAYNWLTTYRSTDKPGLLKWLNRRFMAMQKKWETPAENSENAPHPGAVRLLMWQAMLDAHGRGLIFDLDGTKKEGTDHLYKEFNGLRVVRHVLSRETIPYKFWAAIREPVIKILKKTVGRFVPLFT